MARTSASLWLMNTTAMPVGDEQAQRGEEGVDLLGHEDRGRLVEDEDPAVAREGLEDLDPLLLPDRQVGHAGRRIDTDPEALGRIVSPAAGLVEVETHPARPSEARFSATVIGRTSAKCCVTIPMPASIASRGERMAWTCPSTQDLAGIRVRQPVGDPHDGRLARAVLAEQGVDLPATDIEVDPVVGDEVAEALGDPAQLESGRGWRHAAPHARRRRA